MHVACVNESLFTYFNRLAKMNSRDSTEGAATATTQTYPTATPPERAILVGVHITGDGARSQPDGLRFSVEDSVEELAQLTATAGAKVVEKVIQRLAAPSVAHYVGKGKLQQIVQLLERLDANLVLFDDELSPTQQRNLENALRVKVLDRTALILDIFARRAQTHEGRLQVELAQHEYLLPRLAGQWSHLERLGGGIGTRGPGETQLETDRRLIRRRIERLKGELEAVRRHRALYRRRRSVRGVPVVALVGYTNTGKSTLMNAIAKAGVLAESKLFATLDPTTRRIKLPNQLEVLLTDTVGFIQKLPPHVVAAFRATFEELQEAALLLHIIDISHAQITQQAQTVSELLAELGLAGKPTLLVANKVDLLMPAQRDEPDMEPLARDLVSQKQGTEAVLVSATKGWGLHRLLARITEMLAEGMREVTVLIPYDAPHLLRLFRRYGQVLAEDYQEGGAVLRGKIPEHLQHRFTAFEVQHSGKAPRASASRRR